MLNLVIFLSASIFVVLILLIFFTYRSRKRRLETEAAVQRPRGIPILRGAEVEGPRRAGRNVRARMRAAASRQNDDDEEEVDDILAEDIAMPDGKIGTKKRKKLELKAEKRKERERELEEREERKQRQKQLEELRKKLEMKEKEEEQKLEEEMRAQKEEEQKKELEEYLKLKESFSVEEEGFDQEEVSTENRFQDFIDYIKNQKVVLLEDLASRFKLKTQETIDRIQDLLAQEWLVGVIDDRGKFIYITKEELQLIAQFIKQRGRVSIAELVECSNGLIRLQPDTSEPIQVAS